MQGAGSRGCFDLIHHLQIDRLAGFEIVVPESVGSGGGSSANVVEVEVVADWFVIYLTRLAVNS